METGHPPRPLRNLSCPLRSSFKTDSPADKSHPADAPHSNSAKAQATPRPEIGEFPQNYFQTVACFSADENDRKPATIYHAIHHDFTTKHHAKNALFPKPPSKNAHKTPKTTHSHRLKFFLK